MARQESRVCNGQTGQLARVQVEYYLSDANLQKDNFWWQFFESDACGRVPLAPIFQCNKIKALNISEVELLEAIATSEFLEIADGQIRRKIPFAGHGKGSTELKGSGKGNGKDGKGKGSKGSKGTQKDLARAAPVMDPSGPCGYFMAGYCHHGDSCVTQHSVPYAMAIRREWLNPGDPGARKDLEVAAAQILGEKGARGLFPRVFSEKIQVKRPQHVAGSMSDLGFEWSTECEAPTGSDKMEKASRWNRRANQNATPIMTSQMVATPKIRYILVFDLEGKYEIIEFPVLLFDAVAGSEMGRFQKFVRPKDLFKGCELTETPAVPFPKVLEEFNSWLHQMVGKGLEEMAKDSDMVFMTCGDWDCKHVWTQCQIFGVPCPNAFSRWINIKRSYQDHYGGDFRGMKSMKLC